MVYYDRAGVAFIFYLLSPFNLCPSFTLPLLLFASITIYFI